MAAQPADKAMPRPHKAGRESLHQFRVPAQSEVGADQEKTEQTEYVPQRAKPEPASECKFGFFFRIIHIIIIQLK